MAERFSMSAFLRGFARCLAILTLGLAFAAPAAAQQRRAPANPPQAAKPEPAKPEPVKPRMTREQALDELFARLKATQDEDEAKGIAGAIERVFMQSGSDTADLLMGRAMRAFHAEKKDAAEKLIDSVIAVEPDWAEAWNKRATIRFMNEDYYGAMADIAEVLKREPRHFGALAGMGFMLERMERKPAALRVLRRAAEVHPQMESVKRLIQKLTVEVDGRDI